MSENKIQVYKPFGPSIAKVTIPEDLIKKLNEYVDKIVLDENTQKISATKIREQMRKERKLK